MAQEKRPRQTTTIDDISDDTLEVILQHITSVAVLIRAAATCKLWRRVIGGAGFLRRFRRLNGLHILGYHVYYSNFGSGMFFVSSPAPAAGETTTIIGEISNRASLEFLPRSSVLHDSRGGLIASSSTGCMVSVGSPWTQKQKLFFCPPPPACTAGGFLCPTLILGAFLVDADLDDTPMSLPNLSNFRVLCVELRECRHDGSRNVQVRAFLCFGRDHKLLQLGAMMVGDIAPGATMTVRTPPFVVVGRAGGSICWCTEHNNVVLHLDESSGEFSCFTLPEHTGSVSGNKLYPYGRSNLRVIGGNTGSVHLVRIAGDDLEVLCYDRGVRACVVERRVRASQVPNDDDYMARLLCRRWYFSDDTAEAAAPGSIVLCDNQCGVERVWMFSVDTRNIELERVQKLRNGRAFPYELPWIIRTCL
ncbi:unnamed protein product [Urochloa humidicola]